MVSIIIPVYKVESYLSQCIESILAQTYTNIELILVDDGSPDHSGIICDEYAMKDSRIRVIHKQNRGVSSARNTGLLKAHGDYLVFIDSDDFVDPNYIKLMREADNDICICGSIKHMQDGSTLYQPAPDAHQHTVTKDNLGLWMEKHLLFTVWGKMFRTHIVKQSKILFREDMCYGEDSIFAMEYIKYCRTITILPDTLYHYVKHPVESLTQTVSSKSVYSYNAFDNYIRNWLKNLHLESQYFESVAFPTKKKMQWAFYQVFENPAIPGKKKLEWYSLFFSLPLFSQNIPSFFKNCSPRLRGVIKMRSPLLLFIYEKLGHIRKK